MSSILTTLLSVTLISSAAMLCVVVLRVPLRQIFGARAAYWVWLSVPASIMGLFVPRSHFVTRESTQRISAAVHQVLDAVPVAAAAPNHLDVSAAVVSSVWIVGVLVMLGITAIRQIRFARALAPLSKDSEGRSRSGAIVMPLVIGAWSPRLVIPLNFEQRYSASQRRLMMAHENAHVARWDTRIAALAAGWTCVFWFNPLVYWAVTRLRFDQELACDAAILAQFKGSGRDYATALLDAQMASQSSTALPIACHWQSTHPLNKRIAMLTKKLPGRIRARLGVAVAIALSVLGSAVAWAAQPQDITERSPLALSMIWFADHDPRFPGRIVRMSARWRRVNEGEEFKSMSPDRTYGVACTSRAVVYGADHSEPRFNLSCELSADGQVIAKPAVVIREDKLVALDVRDPDTGTRIYVVLSVTPAARGNHSVRAH